jgi:hypothetical protein
MPWARLSASVEGMFPYSADPVTAKMIATVHRDELIREAAQRSLARRVRDERRAAVRAAARAELRGQVRQHRPWWRALLPQPAAPRPS